MKLNRRIKCGRQQGFSLIELMIVMAVLLVIMGSVFQQIDLVQKRYRSEENKLDIFQGAREFMDQMVRDIHNSGFPNAHVYKPQVFGAPINSTTAAQNQYNAVGLVYVSDTKVVFEGDVDYDGVVDSVTYQLFSNTNDGNCPCTLKRSQVAKTGSDLPTAMPTDFQTELENIIVPNGGSGMLKVFVPYNKNGALTSSTTTLPLTRTSWDPWDTIEAINKVGTIRINMVVRSPQFDIGSSGRPVVFLSASGQLNN